MELCLLVILDLVEVKMGVSQHTLALYKQACCFQL